MMNIVDIGLIYRVEVEPEKIVIEYTSPVLSRRSIPFKMGLFSTLAFKSLISRTM